MDEAFIKLVTYFVTNKEDSEIEKLLEDKDNKKRAIKFTKNLKQNSKKLGFDINFDSFCNMLEYYISNKNKMDDQEKRKYLKNLYILSKIYDVNLREELQNYTLSDKKTKPTKEELFREFCLYNLNEESNVDDFNKLKEIAKEIEADFNEMSKDSLMFTEEIKMGVERLGYSTDKDSVDKMIKEYLNNKKEMSYEDKVMYLKTLYSLSIIYDIDLRKELTK